MIEELAREPDARHIKSYLKCRRDRPSSQIAGEDDNVSQKVVQAIEPPNTDGITRTEDLKRIGNGLTRRMSNDNASPD